MASKGKLEFFMGDTTKNDSSYIDRDSKVIAAFRSSLLSQYPNIKILTVERLSDYIQFKVTKDETISYASLSTLGIYPHSISQISRDFTEVILFRVEPSRLGFIYSLIVSLKAMLSGLFSLSGFWSALSVVFSSSVLLLVMYTCLYIQYVNKPDRYHLVEQLLFTRMFVFSNIVEYIYHMK